MKSIKQNITFLFIFFSTALIICFLVKDISKKNLVNAITSESDYIYTVSATESVVTGYQGLDGIFAPPPTLGGQPVKCIGSGNQLIGYDLITSVDLSNCVNVKIEKYAFNNCNGITSVNLSTCTSIEERAFSGCNNLSGEVNLGACVFIGKATFMSCTKLETVKWPIGITTIPSYIFENCTNFKGFSANSPLGFKDITSISERSFYNCYSLIDLDITSCVFIGNQAFRNCAGIQSVNLSNCTSIEKAAFRNCSRIKSVNLSSCIFIGEAAFRDCSGITGEIDLSSCTSVGYEAFWKCSGITGKINLISCSYLGEVSFESCGIETVLLPPSINSIPRAAFRYCSNLKGFSEDSPIQFKDIVEIGTIAFDGCTSIEGEIDLRNCKKIGNQALYRSSKLIPVFKAGVLSSVGEKVFQDIKYVVIESDDVDNLKQSCNIGGLKQTKRLGRIANLEPTNFMVNKNWINGASETVTHYAEFVEEPSTNSVDNIKRIVKVNKIDNDGSELTSDLLLNTNAMVIKLPINNFDNNLVYKFKVNGNEALTSVENTEGINYAVLSLDAVLSAGTAFELLGIRYVENINIDTFPNGNTIEYLDSFNLNATVLPNDADDKTYTWSTSDSSVLDISSDGKIVAKKVGTVIIKATANDGTGIYGSTNITVSARDIANCTLTEISNQEYSGGSTPTSTLQDAKNGAILVENIDYKVSYENNRNVNGGDVANVPKLIVSGIGNYCGTNYKTFEIYKKEITLNVSVKDKNYDALDVAEFEDITTMNGIIFGDSVVLREGTPTFSHISIGNGIPINFTEFSLTGDDAGNYTVIQPTGIKANITEGFTPIKNTHYTVSLSDGSNDWYKNNPFLITAENGYMISTANTSSAIWLDKLEYNQNTSGEYVSFYIRQKSSFEISVLAKEFYKKDSIGPTGEININENKFTSFLNMITFGLFFKETTNISISGKDNYSESVGIYYQKVSNEKDYDEFGAWLTYTNSFNINPNEKYIIYSKIVDDAGNVVLINSSGIVVYTDSLQDTKKINYTRTSLKNVNASVNLNGNSVNKIFNNSYQLVEGTDYTVNSSTITFISTYMETLDAGEYSFTVKYNPLGEEYVQNSINQEPNSTDISLTVKKANQLPVSIENLNSNYTYGCGNFAVTVSGGSGLGEIRYASSNPSVASVNETTGIVTVLSAGDFEISASKSSDRDYNSFTVSKKSKVDKKLVTITGVSALDKIYDGSSAANIVYNEYFLVSDLVLGDDVFPDISNVSAEFENKNAGDNKRVIFKGFNISGSNVGNYELEKQPASVYKNILQKNVKIEGLSVNNKVYDGKVDAWVAGTAEISGKINEDNLDVVTGNAYFQDKNVGNAKTVIFSSFSLSGNAAHNYNLVSQPENVNGDITPRVLTINVSVKDKSYDGTNAAEFDGDPVLENAIETDNVYIEKNSGIPTFASVGIGTGISVNFEDFRLGGTDKINYDLIQPTGITANIEKGFTAIKETHYTVNADNEGWYNNKFEIYAVNGYLLSTNDTIEGPWTPMLSYSEVTQIFGKDVNFYVKNISTSEISRLVTENYKLDNTNPSGEISIETNKFTEFLNNITFGIFFNKTIDVNIACDDDLSGPGNVEYFMSENKINENEIKNIDGWILGNNFSVQPNKQFVVYAKLKDKAGNTTFISSDGVVVTQTNTTIKTMTNFEEGIWQNNSDSKIDVLVSNEFPIIKSVSYQIGDAEPSSVIIDDKSKVVFSINSLKDGDYKVIVTTTDEFGNSNQKFVWVKKDTLDPEFNFVGVLSDHYVNSGVDIIVSAFDNMSGTESYSFDGGATWQNLNKFTYSKNQVLPNGTIQIKDQAGNIATYNKSIIINKIDMLVPDAPSLTGTFDEWVNYGINIEVSSQDKEANNEFAKSEIDYFEYSLDGGLTYNKVDWLKSQNFSITKDGDYTNKIVAKVTDKAGNTSKSSNLHSVKIDSIGPEIVSVNKDKDTPTNSDVKVSVAAKDSLSGIANDGYSFDSGITWHNNNYVLCSHNQIFESGSIQVKDKAGNITIYKGEVALNNIDKIAPTKPTAKGIPNDWSKEDVTLTVISEDAQSGIDYFEYSLDKGKTYRKVYWSEAQSFKITADGDYTILLKVTDKAGNTSSLSQAYSVKINKSGSSMKKFSQIHEETGIWVEAAEGVLPENLKLVVEEYPNQSGGYKKIYDNLDNNIRELAKKMKLYEIRLVDLEGNIIQPNTNYGLLTIRIPVPENFNKDSLEIYRVQYDLKDDDFNEYLVYLNRYYCEFKTDHLSPYAFIENDTSENLKNSGKYLAILSSLLLIVLLLIIFKKFRYVR